jgi:exonuclease III
MGGGGNSIWNHGLSNSRGVAILFSENIYYDISDITRDIPRRTISCKLNVSGQHSLNLVNVYLPSSGQERENFICNSINTDRQKLNCVAGDFNCTLLKHLD